MLDIRFVREHLDEVATAMETATIHGTLNISKSWTNQDVH